MDLAGRIEENRGRIEHPPEASISTAADVLLTTTAAVLLLLPNSPNTSARDDNMTYSTING